MIKRNGGNAISLQVAFEEFLSEKRINGISEKTISTYQMGMHVFMKVLALESAPVTVLNAKSIEIAKSSLLQRVRPVTINSYLSSIRSFANWCTDKGYIGKVEITKVSGQTGKIKYYTEDDLAVLLKRPTKDDNYTTWRTWITVCLILATGMRASTVCDIHLSDIDMGSKEIICRHLKNKQIAILPISNTLHKNLSDFLHMWSRESNDGYLICTGSEEKIGVNGLGEALGRYCKARGVECKGIHALRHSFARNWVINNGSAFALQKMLTHSTLAMTQKYVRLFDGDLHKGLENYTALDNIYKDNRTTIKRK